MSNSMVDNFGVPELDSHNWTTWSVRMQSSLVISDLWDVTQSEPVYSTDDTTQFTDQDKLKFSSVSKAKAKILLRVSNKLLPHVIDCETSHQVWAKLQHLYRQKSIQQTIYLQKQFHNLRKLDVEDIESYVNRAMELANMLRETGNAVTDSAVAIAILSGLPPSYNIVCTVLENNGIEPTVDLVRNALIRHELQNSRSKSLYSGSQTSSPLDKVIFCKYCKRHGHTVDNCLRLQEKRAREKAASSLITTANDRLADTQPPDTNSPCDGMAFSMVNQASNMLKTTSRIEGGPCQPWIIDSGASYHMTGDLGLLEQGTTDLHVSDIMTADGTVLSSRFKGTVHITAPDGTNIRLLNVLFIPGLAHNLISVKAAMEAGADFQFSKGHCRISCAGRVLDAPLCPGNVFALSAPAQLWHERLGHASEEKLRLLGLPHKLDCPCTPCIQAKQCSKPYKPSGYKYAPLNLLYADLVGPMEVESLSGHRYYLSIYDQGSKASQVYLLPNKSSAVGALMEGIHTFEKVSPGQTVKAVRTDQGSEFLNAELKKFLQSKGIAHETTAGYTPQQNAAERLHRTLNESARALLLSSKLPRTFWGEAIRCANYIRNRLPVKASAEGKCPIELLTNKQPSLDNLRTFGCQAWVLVPTEKRIGKFGPKSVEGTFLGYENSSTYRVLVKDQIVLSRNVEFVESTPGPAANQSQQDLEGQVLPDLFPEPPQLQLSELRSSYGPDGSVIPEDPGALDLMGSPNGERNPMYSAGAEFPQTFGSEQSIQQQLPATFQQLPNLQAGSVGDEGGTQQSQIPSSPPNHVIAQATGNPDPAPAYQQHLQQQQQQ